MLRGYNMHHRNFLYAERRCLASYSLPCFVTAYMSAAQAPLDRLNGYDLKTPLTVIQGKIDLIRETELDDEQQPYAGYITESAGQMGVYIRTLIDIFRTAHIENSDRTKGAQVVIHIPYGK